MGKPSMPKGMSYDPIEMIEKNAEVNRISETNPYGYSRYTTDEHGNPVQEKGLNPEYDYIRKQQAQRAIDGTIKNPLDALKDEGGGGIGGLMSAMAGKMADRYMGTEGGSDSRHENLGKSSKPEPLPEGEALPSPSPTVDQIVAEAPPPVVNVPAEPVDNRPTRPSDYYNAKGNVRKKYRGTDYKDG
jgi:hypothetical protein